MAFYVADWQASAELREAARGLRSLQEKAPDIAGAGNEA